MTDARKITDSSVVAVEFCDSSNFCIAQIFISVGVIIFDNKATEICVREVNIVNSNTGILNGNAIFSFTVHLCRSCFGLCLRHVAFLLFLGFLSSRLRYFILSCRFGILLAIFRQSTLYAADSALCVHCFCRAGRFAGAYRWFLFRVVLSKRRSWHKAEHHAQSEQDTE